jgi:hypothetical protein
MARWNMRSADDIRRLFRNAELRLRPDADERVFADVVQARHNVTKNLPALPESLWRVIMKSPLTKLAVAAAVLIAGVIGLSLWRTTGSGVALADVLTQIEKVKAFRCQWSSEGTVEGPDKPYSQKKRGGGTFISSQEYGRKTILEELDPNGTKSTVEVCGLPDKRTEIRISHKQKKYWRTEWPEPDARAAEEMSKFDPFTLTKRILELKHESLGRSTIDGIEVEGFQTTDPNFLERGCKNPQVDVKTWVDAKTRLPVRYDLLGSFETDSMGNRMVQHMVMNDFQWDVPVDASEFKPVIPDDYIGVVIKYPEHITEETAIQGLKLWGELLGNYPGRITNVDGIVLRLAKKSETPAALRLREEIAGLTDEEALNKLVDFLMPIRGLAGFSGVLERDKKDPAYYGKTVVPKDADNILMRWKVSDKEYRVIYGDLHTETVTPERLAELEAALPDEQTAIQGLKLLVELLGKYPDPNMNVTDFTVLWSAIKKSETPAALQLKEDVKGLTEEEINHKLEDFLMPIRGLVGFLTALARDKKDLEYVVWKYGKPLTIKDADKVLLRWKVSDNEYRVIFGDLHAETVSPEKLAELEKTLPK